MRRLIEIATERRVTIVMSTVAILLFGLVSLSRLSVNLLPDISYPIVPGHEIVGHAIDTGDGVIIEKDVRLGVPWLGYTCGRCSFCRGRKENLCDEARFTGYQIDGGFADYVLADHRYCFPLPESYSDEQAAPLLCAGLIGYRCLRMTGQARNIGIYGFGAAAHVQRTSLSAAANCSPG